jgi:hypothetical protein
MNPKVMMTNAAAMHSVTDVLSCHFLGFLAVWFAIGAPQCGHVSTLSEVCRLFPFRLAQAISFFSGEG